MKAIKVFRSGLHLGEERIVEGNQNSAMVTFSGCHLSCNFCYTPETSVEQQGVDYTPQGFSALIDELVTRGARNLNLISPSHVWGAVRPALTRFKERYGQRIPLILKTSGYEKEGLTRSFVPLADIFVPDFKAWSPAVCQATGLPPDYGHVAQEAIRRLLLSHGRALYTEQGKLSRGILVRHLLMPGFFEDSLHVIDALAELRYAGYLNLMTYFIDPASRRVLNANPAEVESLALAAAGAGMRVLVNGREWVASSETGRCLSHG